MENSWSRPTRYIVFAIMAGAFLWFIFSVRALIPSLVVSALLAYILNPVVVYVNRGTKLPRKYVVTLVYILLLGGITLLAVTFTPVIVDQSQTVIEALQNAQDELIADARILAEQYNIDFDFNDMGIDFEELIVASFNRDQIFSVVQSTSQNLVWVLIIIVTTYYLLQDWHRLREWLLRLAPPDHRPDARRLYGLIKRTWQAYLSGQLVLILIIGSLSWLGSFAVGLNGAFALGVMAGLLDVIPSAGPLVAMVIATAVAWFQGPPEFLDIPNTWYAVLVLGIFTIIQTLENIWIRPRVMGQSLKLHPAIVFIAVMGSLAIGGILVTLLVIPTVGTLIIIGRYLRARMFGLDPWTEDDMDFIDTEYADETSPAPVSKGLAEIDERPQPGTANPQSPPASD